MANEIEIKKTVVNKTQFDKIVNNTFTTFLPPQEEQPEDSIDELFRLYDKFYFEIDLTGNDNSHEYLIRRSSELIQLEKSTEEIQPLLDEIAQLRAQLLEANRQILDLESNLD